MKRINDVAKSDDATMELAVAKSGHDEEIASINEDKVMIEMITQAMMTQKS